MPQAYIYFYEIYFNQGPTEDTLLEVYFYPEGPSPGAPSPALDNFDFDTSSSRPIFMFPSGGSYLTTMLPGTYFLPANAQYSGVSVTTRDGSGSGGAYPTDGVLTVTVATPEPSAARLLLCAAEY